MMGQSYGPDDRADAASRILIDVWADLMAKDAPLYSVAQRVPTSLVGDEVSYSAKSRQKGKDDRPDVWADIPAVRKADLPHFSALAGRAANLRRSLDRDRLRDALDAAERAASEGFLPYVPDADPEVRSTPQAAHALAIEMVEAVRIQTRPVYVATYTAARSASGEASDVIAEELEMAPSAYRQSLKRGRDAIAEHYATAHALAERLSVPEGGLALKPSMSRMRAASIGDRADGWRDSQRAYGIRPVEAKSIDVGSLPCAPPQWARDLRGTTAARLRHAARRQAEMVRAKTPGERAQAHLTAGLPA